MANRKLGRPTDQRKALLRNQVTNLIWHGRIETTLPRAKEVSSIAEKLITLAARECDNTLTVSKNTNNEKGQTVVLEVINDAPSRLAARRRMMSYLYDIPAPREEDETRKEYKARARMIKHPVVEKLMREIGPKYKARAAEKGTGGGYTRIIKTGFRLGDNAATCFIELVDFNENMLSDGGAKKAKTRRSRRKATDAPAAESAAPKAKKEPKAAKAKAVKETETVEDVQTPAEVTTEVENVQTTEDVQPETVENKEDAATPEGDATPEEKA